MTDISLIDMLSFIGVALAIIGALWYLAFPAALIIIGFAILSLALILELEKVFSKSH